MRSECITDLTASCSVTGCGWQGEAGTVTLGRVAPSGKVAAWKKEQQ